MAPTRIIAILACALSLCAHADDVFYDIRIADLQFTEGALPVPDDSSYHRNWRRAPYMSPRVVLDGPGEAYTAQPSDPNRFQQSPIRDHRLHIRAPEGERITGTLILPKRDYSAMVVTRFAIEPDEARPFADDSYFAAKRDHYEQLQARTLPGSAWFRFRARQAHASLGASAPAGPRRAPRPDLDDAFALFTGGRALTENLQLDRTLPQLAPGARSVDIDSLEGITVAEYDWEELTSGIDADLKLDPLASLIPHDQHAAFFPSFNALMQALDELDQGELPIFQLTTPRPEDARTLERYERQLALPRTALARLLGPAFVQSVALTGSDPYFPSGTDLALLFQPADAPTLRDILFAQIQTSAQRFDDAEPVNGEIAGIPYKGFRTPTRTLCSYAAIVAGTVVVTNSLAQLQRLAEVQRGETASLASLDEFRFFRDRYKLGHPDETALLMLSDATIRRWAGPRWRIATARRMLAASVLADATCRLIDDPQSAVVLLPESQHLDLGAIRRTPTGIHSARFGSLEFQTPIAELELDKASEAEAQAYRRWRNGYQRNWRWAFDPIAMRLTAEPDRLAADLTVMPLIGSSEYNMWVAFSDGAKIGNADVHDALIHVAASINTESQAMQQYANMARGMMMLQFNPLDWVGETIAIYAEPDPIWQELADAEPHEVEGVIGKAKGAIPVAMHVEVRSMVKLTAFLAGARAMFEQTTPGTLAWEPRTHGDQGYTRVGLSESAKTSRAMDQLSVYYAAMPEGLVVSLHEGVLRRAIDRHLAQRNAGGEGNDTEIADAVGDAGSPWLGENLALRIDADGWETLLSVFDDQFEDRMQRRAWDNIPILNEWRRLHQNTDPVAFHLERFRTRLVDPGGGAYVWNEGYRTMESTTYGHPGQPREGPALGDRLRELGNGRLGITFENDGLRAKTELRRADK